MNATHIKATMINVEMSADTAKVLVCGVETYMKGVNTDAGSPEYVKMTQLRTVLLSELKAAGE